ncbi:MAG: hypothetical protein QMB42_03510 [SAR324 cluster bacterium]|jgi:hypothetical protein|tara:strand:- start:65 stop:214 length:150 start_codon:yes stop_codon:yes gene_type:complete
MSEDELTKEEERIMEEDLLERFSGMDDQEKWIGKMRIEQGINKQLRLML